MAKITGYQLREAIKQHSLRKDALERVLEDSYKAFPGEEKAHPKDVLQTLEQTEVAIAQLQVAQMTYNLKVKVEAGGEKMTLAEAVKRVGYLARAEKAWKKAGGEVSKDRYSVHRTDERDPEKQYSVYRVTPLDAAEEATRAAARTSAFRNAIALGNATEVKFEEDLPLPSLG